MIFQIEADVILGIRINSFMARFKQEVNSMPDSRPNIIFITTDQQRYDSYFIAALIICSIFITFAEGVKPNWFTLWNLTPVGASYLLHYIALRNNSNQHTLTCYIRFNLQDAEQISYLQILGDQAILFHKNSISGRTSFSLGGCEAKKAK